MIFVQVKAGQWVRPVQKGYQMECCACGLVHTVDFEIVGKSWWRVLILRALGAFVVLRMFRDADATEARRRARSVSVDNLGIHEPAAAAGR